MKFLHTTYLLLVFALASSAVAHPTKAQLFALHAAKTCSEQTDAIKDLSDTQAQTLKAWLSSNIATLTNPLLPRSTDQQQAIQELEKTGDQTRLLEWLSFNHKKLKEVHPLFCSPAPQKQVAHTKPPEPAHTSDATQSGATQQIVHTPLPFTHEYTLKNSRLAPQSVFFAFLGSAMEPANTWKDVAADTAISAFGGYVVTRRLLNQAHGQNAAALQLAALISHIIFQNGTDVLRALNILKKIQTPTELMQWKWFLRLLRTFAPVATASSHHGKKHFKTHRPARTAQQQPQEHDEALFGPFPGC